MTNPQFGTPEWQRQFSEAVAEAGRAMNDALAKAHNILTAQTAMGYAYRGDLEAARRALSPMGPEQLRALSAAASMLTALADEELANQ